MMENTEVIIKCRHVVTPAKPTWKGILPLSILDQVGVITHTPLVYFYKKPTTKTNSSINNIVITLKESLSHALVIFYPLAGRLHYLKNGRMELECNAMGVELIEAESSKEMKDYLSCFEMFEGLIPPLSYDKSSIEEQIPQFLAQVTSFKCGGYTVGLAIPHVIMDGNSTGHFMVEWAKLSRGEPPSNVTYYHNRLILKAKEEDGSSLNGFCPEVVEASRLPTLVGNANNLKERRTATEGRMLHLTRKQVDCLKKEANEGLESNSRRPYGRFEAIAAHVWRCASKARVHKNEQMTAMCFSVDFRSRLNPPLPPSYFGNAMVDMVAYILARELIEMPLAHSCQRIRDTIEKATDDYIWSTIKFLEAQKTLVNYQERDELGDYEGIFYGNPNIGVASWLNLPIYGVDFGWGKEVFVGPGDHEADGNILISRGYGSDGPDGSVVVTVGLQDEHMVKFQKYFYDDIAIQITSRI